MADSFLIMPRELRDKVYRYLLTSPPANHPWWVWNIYNPYHDDDDDEVVIPGSENIPWDDNKNNREYPLHPAILRTCQQVHGEAYKVPYEANNFWYSTPRAPWIPPCSTDDCLPDSLMPLSMLAYVRNLHLALSCQILSRGRQSYDFFHLDEMVALVRLFANYATGLKTLELSFRVDWLGFPYPTSLPNVLGAIEKDIPNQINRMKGLRSCEIEQLPKMAIVEKLQVDSSLERCARATAAQGGWTYEKILTWDPRSVGILSTSNETDENCEWKWVLKRS